MNNKLHFDSSLTSGINEIVQFADFNGFNLLKRKSDSS